ncbi:MAG: hypothetical protein KIS92_26100 [Planctomycetota bacterium]|nr:hypothetical protein [Planctomycetota bacterium]
MPISDQDAVDACARLIAFAVLLQALELFQLRRAFAHGGIWTWEVLRDEFAIFPGIVRAPLGLFLGYPRFLFVIFAQTALAVSVLIEPREHPAVFLGLLAATALVSLRWRGSFNGGADYMTVLVLLALSVEACFRGHAAVRHGCLWYVAVQTALSYAMAGAVKLRNAGWRSGRALARFLSGPPYEPPEACAALARRPGLMRMSSWGIMLFEVSFPLGLTSPTACAGVLAAALVFHLLNVAVFGLNRFVFAWLAAYPALLYCSAP